MVALCLSLYNLSGASMMTRVFKEKKEAASFL